VPDALVNVVGAGAGADAIGVAANDFVPCVCFECPDGFGEETCSYQVKEACRYDEEDLQLWSATESVPLLASSTFGSSVSACLLVDQITDGETCS
jgi:hypothetical protein